MCLIYNDRPGVCALYPIDQNDIKELKKTMPQYKCDYYFDGVLDHNANREVDKLFTEVYSKKRKSTLKGTLKILILSLKDWSSRLKKI
ncbi:MAG: hypothetical protein HY606_14955 [Planctomycetes bacterium]|nr:hypothetical protein [Planctomycetota bacterium]